jgi:hypothetical protein
MQASEGESERSQGSSDEEEKGASIVPPNVATTSSEPSSFATQNASSAGAWPVGRTRRTRRRGMGMMKKGRRMSSLPLH